MSQATDIMASKTYFRRPTMNAFLIKEDFPKSEIEFDQRFLNASAC